MKLFTYDVFLSHRIGDNAHTCRDQLVACGCTVWFDENRPLEDRQLFSLIRNAHAASCVTIAYLSSSHAPSPWTVLEMLTTLRGEQHGDIKRLFFFGPVDVLESSRTWSLPEALTLALATPARWLEREVPAFAARIAKLNKELVAHRPLARLSRARCIERMRRSIKEYAPHSRATAELPLLPPLTAQFTVGEMEQLRLAVASAALDWTAGNATGYDLQDQSFKLRQLEELLSSACVQRTGAELTLISAIACCLVAAGGVNDRAEGMYLLRAISSDPAARRAHRLLKWALRREPDWSLIRCFIPAPDGQGAQAWPHTFPALEAALLQSGDSPAQDALEYIGPDVKLRVDRNRQMSADDLPFVYRAELELHWLRMLASQVRDAGQDQTNLNTFEARCRIQMIDVELAHRNLNALLAEGFVTAPRKEFDDVLGRIMVAEHDLIETSERHHGAPLSSFARYFVDHLLPILAVGILVGREAHTFERLADRCCQIFSAYNNLDSHEIDAYRAYWSTCLQWREAHGPGLAEHLLGHSVNNGFSANTSGLLNTIIR